MIASVLEGFPFTWTNQLPFFSLQGFAGFFSDLRSIYRPSHSFPLFNLKDLYRVNYLIPYFRFTGFLQGLGSLSSVMYVLFMLFGQYLHDNDIHMTLAHKV